MKSFLRHARHVLGENPITLAAFGMVFALGVVALVGPFIAPYDPLKTSVVEALQRPSAAHWFGTDQLGRDVLSRVLVATRLDMLIAVSAVAASFVVGTLLGAFAGFLGGWTERIVSRCVDTIMAFPLFVLAMGIVAALGNTVANIIYATAIINLPFFARMARAEVNARRSVGYIEAAQVSGNSRKRIVLFYLIPNILPPLTVQISLNMGWAILNAAGLSFIGLGIRAPTPEWGIMVADGASFIISGSWWVALFPGLALTCAVLCFNLLGDGLRDIIDPKRRT